MNCTKVDRKVQGVPQSEEENRDKNERVQNKQTNAREAHRPAPSSPSEMITTFTEETRGQRARQH